MSRDKYIDCFLLLEQALEDKAGIRVHCITEGKARNLNTRLNQARAMHREEYGASAYDSLAWRTREAEGDWWVYIEHTGEVESLSEAKDGMVKRSDGDHRETKGEGGASPRQTKKEKACQGPSTRRY